MPTKQRPFQQQQACAPDRGEGPDVRIPKNGEARLPIAATQQPIARIQESFRVQGAGKHQQSRDQQRANHGQRQDLANCNVQPGQ